MNRAKSITVRRANGNRNAFVALDKTALIGSALSLGRLVEWLRADFPGVRIIIQAGDA